MTIIRALLLSLCLIWLWTNGCAGSVNAHASSASAWPDSSLHPLRVALRVQEAAAVPRWGELITSGVPLPKDSGIASVDRLAMVNSEGSPVPAQFRVLSRWGPLTDANAPLRWVLVDWRADATAAGSSFFFLTEQDRSKTPGRSPEAMRVTETLTGIEIDVGVAVIRVPKEAGYLIRAIRNGHTFETRGLRVVKGTNVFESALSRPTSVVIAEQGPLRTTIAIKGTFKDVEGQLLIGGDGRAEPAVGTGRPASENKPLQYTIWATAYQGRADIKLTVRLENNGDGSAAGAYNPSNDIFFDAVYLDTALPAAASLTAADKDHEITLASTDRFVLLQQHEINDPSDETKNFRYRALVNGATQWHGERFPGWLTFRSQAASLFVGVPRFWQNYPKSMEFFGRTVSIGLWPQDGGALEVGYHGKGRYFFSGGWHKTYELSFGFFDSTERSMAESLATHVAQPLKATSAPEWIAKSRAWSLIASDGMRSSDTELQEALDRYERYVRILIDSGASHDGVDMATMREHRGYPKWSCDWYGWEDFGDLMHGGNPCQPSSLIYDWPYIMWLQYARSGDERFRMLAEEMTDHSRDMDQHHNENDAGQGTVANIADGIWNWENGKFRGHHINFNSAGNIVSHTWNGGYALGYLLTGNPTYLEAARRSAMAGWRFWFLYKKVDKGPVKYDQTRSQGWTILMLVNLYRITGERDLLEKAMQVFTNSLLYTEQLPDPPGSGGKGYISVGEYYDKSYIGKVVATFATYHLEPLIELHVEAVRVGIPVDGLERFLFRSVDWLKNYAYVGGKALGPRKYVPLMLSYSTDPVNRTANKGAYVTMNGFVASASAYASLLLKDKDPARAQTYLDFARRLFKDLMFYMDFRGHPSDGSIDPTLRSKIWWLSVYGVGPKVMGWIGRGGQPYLYVESIQAAPGRADN